MTESTKTISFVGAAFVLVLLAFFTRPKSPYTEPAAEVNQKLFAEWKDPTAAKGIEITTYDKINGVPEKLALAQVDKGWVVASNKDYPAAEDHVVPAIKDLINLKVLAVVSDKSSDHEMYGVVEPDPIKLRPGALGVGKMVVVRDEAQKELGRLIIGNESKKSPDAPGSNNRFVRRVGQDPVYLVALSADLYSTKFQDWIETDLLGMKQQPFDIKTLLVRDYALDETLLVRKADIDLTFDDSKNQWALKQLTTFKDNKPSPGKLAADEQINDLKLNELKPEILNMKIANVRRKPESMAAQLKAGKDYLGDPAAVNSLEKLRFVPLPLKKPTDIFSVGGDLTIGMKDGVEYVIRFGDFDYDLTRGQGADPAKKQGVGAKKQKSPDLQQRFVFITASFNENLLPKPMLELVPAVKKPDEKKLDEKKPDEKKTDEKKPVETKPDGKKPDDKKPEEKKADETKAADKKSNEKKPDAQMADDKKEPDDAQKPADSKKSDESKKPNDGKKPDESKKPADDKEQKAPNSIKQAEEEAARDAERKRIEADTHRKMEDYKKLVKKGQDHARELNSRFVDWYFMISEDDYKKVHVGLSEIIKKKGPAEPDAPPGPRDPFQNRPHTPFAPPGT